MRPIALFGTKDCPLHCSALATIMQCSWRSALTYLFEPEDPSGAAANTGSAIHAAIAAWHRGKDEPASVEEMCARVHEYPQADLAEAADIFLAYAADPKNQSAEIVLCEEQVSFALVPDPSDPTQAPIEVIGRCDQVRRENGIDRVWDVKSSSKDPIDLVNSHMVQVAAYCVGASLLLQRRVEPGGLILVRNYKRRMSVFRHVAWRYSDIEHILRPVRRRVAEIRAAQFDLTSGDHCKWCPVRTPELCLPKLKETRSLLSLS